MSYFWGPPALPRAYVFACNNLHIHLSHELMNIVEVAAKKPRVNVTISLITITDESADDLLVSMRKVMKVAQIMSGISSHHALQAPAGCVDVILAFEIGKLALTLNSEDVVVVLCDSDEIAATFVDCWLGGPRVRVQVFSSYLPDISSAEKKR